MEEELKIIETNEQLAQFIGKSEDQFIPKANSGKVWFWPSEKDVTPIETIDVKITPDTIVKERETIQDRIKSVASQLCGEIEGELDKYYITKKSNFLLYNFLSDKKITPQVATHIERRYVNNFNELFDAVNEVDSQLIEGYSFLSREQLIARANFIKGIVEDCSRYLNNTRSNAPRKKRYIAPAKRIKGLKYLAEFQELKIMSITPEKIIDSKQLWVYNIKTRQLAQYVTNSTNGLQVKGSTIQGYHETESIGKTLRKPAEVLKKVLEGGAIALRKVMDGINSKSKPLTGRINKDTILLRVG
jgi:hypothetical protein